MPLPGVTVSSAGAATAASDALGNVTVTINVGASSNIKFSKAGYSDQFLTVDIPSGAGTDGYFEVTMRTRDTALTLADSAVGGSLTGRDGATIALPPNASSILPVT